MGERVEMTRGVPSLFGGRSFTAIAQEACGLGGPPTTSIRHMRQLPAIESRSWKQKRGISAPAASHACSSVYSAGTSISVPSTMSLVMSVQSHPDKQCRRDRKARCDVDARQQCKAAPEAVMRQRAHAHLAVLYSCAEGRLSPANAWSL